MRLIVRKDGPSMSFTKETRGTSPRILDVVVVSEGGEKIRASTMNLECSLSTVEMVKKPASLQPVG
jgi:hypothetical protein